MRTYDFAPLTRSSIGFDRLFDLINSNAQQLPGQEPGFPPYDITRTGDDSYRIARVEKADGDKWKVVSIFSVQGREMEVPSPCSVKFAGDASILILDNVRAGTGRANWSARVMFHDDVYAGRWWETANKEHGGTISGTITQAP